jgi:type IV fimbrial biogenesis protein FimT
MLNVYAKSAGFTLVEVLVAVAIIALGLTLGVSSYRQWVQNTQIRNAAESVQNGLQRARAEAVGRNSNVAFLLTGTGAVPDSSWQVYDVSASAANPASAVIDARLASEGSKNVTASGVAADGATEATIVTFSSLATVVANAGSPVPPTLRAVNLTSTVLPAADSRNLRVTIGINGVGSNIRMCDPNLPASSPAAC